ncbi:hypothetical protein DXM29_20730 [Agrobacterium tumefaciens]|nr:hypothetical protein DXM29_20730 [Agrobacterium tumefaciens]
MLISLVSSSSPDDRPCLFLSENNLATDHPFRSLPDKTIGLAYRRDQSPQQMLDAGLAPFLRQRARPRLLFQAQTAGTNSAVCIGSENLPRQYW